MNYGVFQYVRHLITPGYILIWLFQLFIVSCRAQEIPGCTDPLANNFESSATMNDASCTYDPYAVVPSRTEKLSDQLTETSGLILWNDLIWTHNDNEDTNLYGIDPGTADIEETILIAGVENQEWEEISQDEYYIYLGDFGNNATGNRQDLHILRIEKSTLYSENQKVDTIWFSYQDQIDFQVSEPNSTDFDCEAFVVAKDSIYLFTKQWTSKGTSVYSLPKAPGTFVARLKGSHDTQGLITGATGFEASRLIVLCGYTNLLHPFLVLLYDYDGKDFFSGNKRRLTLSLPFHQVEGIDSEDGLTYYISNEEFELLLAADNPQKLHVLNLHELLSGYLDQVSGSIKKDTARSKVYPNPARDEITIHSPNGRGNSYSIIDLCGIEMLSGELQSDFSTIDLTGLVPGIYFCMFGTDRLDPFKFQKF